MASPFFYIPSYTGQSEVELEEDTSRHIVQVLRMRVGEELHLTDGKGSLLAAEIREAGKKHCVVGIKTQHSTNNFQESSKVSIGISLLKNSNRFEWFLEKATEIGVREIIPLLCERTEKEKFRYDRMQSICISAMLQSRQCWLPQLQQPQSFSNVVKNASAPKRFIAHCIGEGERKSLSSLLPVNDAVMILIGPEGDFTEKEIHQAMDHSFLPVSLGNTRLRTETAGMVVAALLCQG